METEAEQMENFPIGTKLLPGLCPPTEEPIALQSSWYNSSLFACFQPCLGTKVPHSI